MNLFLNLILKLMKPDLYIVPVVTVHPNQINIHSEINWVPYRPKIDKIEAFRNIDNSHNNKISDTARRKINKAVQYLMFIANDKTLPDTAHGKAYKFKLSFITLTLPSKQQHSDNEIKSKCLNQFLIEARKKWNVHNYVWRAEKQKNGNIHFHVLSDKFIPWSELRDVWNRIINKLGYVDAYRQSQIEFHKYGFKLRKDLVKYWPKGSQIKAYEQGKVTDWNSPNSTDVHSVHKIKDLAAYIAKYATKDEINGELKGRLWGCSVLLSNIPGGKLVIDQSISRQLSKLCELFPDKVYRSDYFTTIRVNVFSLLQNGFNDIFRVFADFLVRHFGFNYSHSLFPT